MKRIIIYVLSACIGLGVIGAAVAAAVIMWASQDLPSITKVHDYRMPLVTTVYDRENNVIGYFCNEKRFLVNMDVIPPVLRKAFIAVEDKNFMTHVGIDPLAIVRAFIRNLRSGTEKEGASTITQQVVKRILLDAEKSYVRKIKEAILAYRLEKYLTKDEILYIYLNQIYLGNSAYGVEAAARTYFGKHVNELNTAECAMLAGLPQAPSRTNPFTEPEEARKRQLWVLNRMRVENYLSEEEYQAAVETPMEFKSMPDPSWRLGAWYLEEVRRQLLAFFSEDNVKRLNLPLEMYGRDAVYDAGLHVYTAMDPVHQKAAELALRSGLHEGTKRRGWRGPLETIPKGEFDAYLTKISFAPEALENAGWAKALVTEVTPKGAKVRLGESYIGYIDVKYLGWARVPNTNISPEGAGRVTDAAKVLAPGDVVYVSALGASGDLNPVSVPADPENKKDPVPRYDPATVEPSKPIQLCLEQMPDLQGALTSIDIASGDLVAIVGGYEFSPSSQFNRATQAHRQPGSSFKPIVYSAALDNGFTAGTIILDFPFVLQDDYTKKLWKPGNYDHKFMGPILFRTALALSRNVCTVRVAQQVGMGPIIQRAHELGITGEIPEVLAVSLGSYEATPLTMAEAYTAFADQGIHTKPRIITHVEDCWRQPLLSFEPVRRQAISPQNAYIMSSILKDVVTSGTASRARVLGRPIGGKTGTSNDERDCWFIGFSPYLVTSIWLGYDNNAPMGRMETGGRAALPVFINYRQAVDPLYEPVDFPMPSDIVMVTVDADTGYLAGPGSGKTFSLPFIQGTEPRYGSVARPEAQTGEDLLKEMF